MVLNALVEKLKRRSKDDFKGRHFEATLILQAVSWYLRYPLSYRDIEELFLERGLDIEDLSQSLEMAVKGAGRGRTFRGEPSLKTAPIRPFLSPLTNFATGPILAVPL